MRSNKTGTLSKNKWRKGRVIRLVILLLILVYLVYLFVGAMAPFVRFSETGHDLRDTSDYFGNGEIWVERATVLEENDDALDWRLRMIDKAETSIFMATYQFIEGESTRTLAASLKTAAERGVSVRILVDGFNCVTRMEGKTFFEALSVIPGVEIGIYNRPSLLIPKSLNARLHDKYFVVDDIAYIIGGRNTHDGFLGENETELRNYDREALIFNSEYGTADGDNASIHALDVYFNELWNSDAVSLFNNRGAKITDKKIINEYEKWESFRSTPTDDFDSLIYSATLPTEKITLVTGDIGIGSKEPHIWNEIINLAGIAKDRVLIQTPYILCSDGMYEDLTSLTASGISVTMLTNSMLNTDNVFAPPDYLYHQDEILDTGVGILEFDGAYSTHAKTVLIDDDIVIIGSFNVDLRSTYMNTEVVAVIVGEEFTEETESCMDAVLSSSVKIGEGNTVGVRLKEQTNLFHRVWLYILGAILQPFRFEL